MTEKHDRRNTLTVGIVAGLLGGLILAMILQVFDVGKLKDVPAWLQGISAIFATLVSIYAVYLVSQTLQATRQTLDQANETLKVTQQMAEDQKEIGDAQTRPWVAVIKAEYDYAEDPGEIRFDCKNFGNSPAIDLLVKYSFEYYTSHFVGGVNYDGEIVRTDVLDTVAKSLVIPGEDFHFTTEGLEMDMATQFNVRLVVKMRYRMQGRKKVFKHKTVIAGVENFNGTGPYII